jgi:hypothetical protein
MFAAADNEERIKSAEKIRHEAQWLAISAGIGVIGVTWNNGQRMEKRRHHMLQLFRGDAISSVRLSDDELNSYPDGLNAARTNAKLGAMVRELSKCLQRQRSATLVHASKAVPIGSEADIE